jgi:hypothetical protein
MFYDAHGADGSSFYVNMDQWFKYFLSLLSQLSLCSSFSQDSRRPIGCSNGITRLDRTLIFSLIISHVAGVSKEFNATE